MRGDEPVKERIKMKMSFGKYKGISICFINSGYLQFLIKQDWFVMKYDEEVVVAVEKELYERDRGRSHFYEDKVILHK